MAHRFRPGPVVVRRFASREPPADAFARRFAEVRGGGGDGCFDPCARASASSPSTGDGERSEMDSLGEGAKSFGSWKGAHLFQNLAIV